MTGGLCCEGAFTKLCEASGSKGAFGWLVKAEERVDHREKQSGEVDYGSERLSRGYVGLWGGY